MPEFTFSERDLLRGKILPPAWYQVRIDGVGEKPSNDGGSTNYPIEGTILKNAETGDVEHAGVPLDWMFNSKALGFSVGFFQALGAELKPGSKVDLNASVGRTLEVYVENDTWQGRVKNQVNHKYRKDRVPE